MLSSVINYLINCENNRRYVVSDVHPFLAEVRINSGNEVHSNKVHTTGVST